MSLITDNKEYPSRFTPKMDSEDVEAHILQNTPKWYSACRTVDDLKGAYDHSGGLNDHYKDAAIIITEPTKTLSAIDLGLELNASADILNHKDENEIIPVEDISTKKILVIIDKKDKEAFYAGKRVDNMMASFRDDVPSIITKSEVDRLINPTKDNNPTVDKFKQFKSELSCFKNPDSEKAQSNTPTLI